MGPTSSPSYSDLRYMMVVVDDFSRYSWVYFLENKSEALTYFMRFQLMVEKEFSSAIKCLRIDDGGEILSHEFSRFCKEHGIKRQFTCPNTPQ